MCLEMMQMCKTIVIDPGHGGSDPGAIGNDLYEKELTLDISNRTKEYLEKHYTGHKVLLTRTHDEYLTLAQRAQFANNNKADLFISMHINSGGGTGYESFIHTNTQATTSGMQNLVHAEAIKEMKATDRGKKKANFAVLRLTKMPAILPENLFIDRKEDAVKLKQSSFIDKIAKGHAEGIAKALGLKIKSTGVTTQPSTPSNPTTTTAKTYKLVKSVAGYVNAADAIVRRNKKTTVKANTYHIYKESNGMINVSTKKSSPGSWINPSDNENTSEISTQKTFEVGQKVKIKSSAKTYSRSTTSIPSAYKNKSYTIQQVGKDDVLITELFSWVKKIDIL